MITTSPRACAAAQSLDDVGHRRPAGTATTARSTPPGMSRTRAVPGHPGDGLGIAVDRVGSAGEPARRAGCRTAAWPILCAVGARADDGDRPRAEQALDRARLGALLALAHHRLGHRGLVDRELQRAPRRTRASGSTSYPASRNTRIIPVFSASTIAWKRLMPALARRGGQMLEQYRADAAALVRVGDDERHLGLVGVVDLLVAADGDDGVAQHRDQGDAVLVVDVGEPEQVARRDARVGREVAQVARAGGQPGVELDDRGRVRRAHRADVHAAAVGAHDVGRPVRGRLRCLTVLVVRHDLLVIGRDGVVTGQRRRDQSRGSSGSSPSSGKTAGRVAPTARSSQLSPPGSQRCTVMVRPSPMLARAVRRARPARAGGPSSPAGSVCAARPGCRRPRPAGASRCAARSAPGRSRRRRTRPSARRSPRGPAGAAWRSPAAARRRTGPCWPAGPRGGCRTRTA